MIDTIDHERQQAEALAAQLSVIAWRHELDDKLKSHLAALTDDELRREIALLKLAVQRAESTPSPEKARTLMVLSTRFSASHPGRPRVDDLEAELQERFGMTVASDGLLECPRITFAMNWVGDLPFALYHHTSTALLDSIRRDGLLVGRQTNFFNSQAGVYVSTISSGTPVETYSRRAARVHGGEPMTLRVARQLADLTPDPDDADLAWAQGRQFITPAVPVKSIRWDTEDSSQADQSDRKDSAIPAPAPGR